METFFWCFGIVVILMVVVALAVPLSVLTWWAGWRKRAECDEPLRSTLPQLPPSNGPFVVYLSGIGDISGDYQSRYEDELLEEVAERIPGLRVVTDVFGFSVDNQSLTSEPALGWFWAWISEIRLRKGSPLKRMGNLISMRNMLHIAVSADHRYGPIYNYGVAEMILRGLLRQGYQPGQGTPVTLLGYSGGGQIALATAGYVQATLRVPVQVISLAGVFSASPSLNQISAFTHLYGTQDNQVKAGYFFPGRWPLFQGSPWAIAQNQGKVRLICLGPMVHSGRNGYLDATKQIEDGRSFQAVTADAIAEQIRRLI
ncbi:MAG: hypothetical protein AB4911_21965 [Oscillochloridaceae bacterium umkhey_bin13]